MTHIFLTERKKRGYKLREYAKEANLCKRTIYYLQNENNLISLKDLCLLFSTTLTQGMLKTGDMEFLINLIVRDSLPKGAPQPILRILTLPKEKDRKQEKQKESQAINNKTVPLSEFMKSLRTKRLKLSAREATLRFENCTPSQIKAIETDCHGVRISTICKLFNNYLCETSTIPDSEWGTFATLLLQHYLPLVKDYAIKFLDWKM